METTGISWNQDQKIALDRISEWISGSEKEISLTGAAGCGKTLLLAEIIKRLNKPFMLTALTGNAALRIRELTNNPATTLHSVLFDGIPLWKNGLLEFSKIAKPKGDFLIVDESSMMGPKLY